MSINAPVVGLGQARAAPPTLAPEQYAEFLSRPFVQVIVGPDSSTKTFTLSKHILARVSPFFEKAFSGSFAEGISGVLEMPETTIKAFEYAVAHIFSIENRFVKFDIKKFASEDDFISVMIELSALSQLLIIPTLHHQHVANAFEVLHDKSEVRGAIVRTTLAHFSQKTWDVSTRDILVDWKLGGALVGVPGFIITFLLVSKDFNMGRIRL